MNKKELILNEIEKVTEPLLEEILDFVRFLKTKAAVERLNRSVERMKKTQNKVCIDIPREKVAEFCKRNHIRKLALFGSVLREDFQSNIDIDVLVEFESGHVPGLAFFSMEAELSDMLGRKVDLNTPNFLSPYFRDKVLAEAEVFYANA